MEKYSKSKKSMHKQNIWNKLANGTQHDGPINEQTFTHINTPSSITNPERYT